MLQVEVLYVHVRLEIILRVMAQELELRTSACRYYVVEVLRLDCGL